MSYEEALWNEGYEAGQAALRREIGTAGYVLSPTIQGSIRKIQDAVFEFVISGGEKGKMGDAKLGMMLEALVIQAKQEERGK